jgi:hypothetical protein
VPEIEAVTLFLEEERRLLRLCQAEEWYKLYEYWIQIYVREHADQLGMQVVEPLRPSGPDFRVVYRRRRTDVEVERRWDDYLRHKHHLDNKYRGVGILVVVSGDPPIPPLRHLLPLEIVYLPEEEYLVWYHANGERFKKEVQELLDGQHTSHRLATLKPEERNLLRLQGLIARIAINEMPDAGVARDELLAWLEEQDDGRADEVRRLEVPRRSISMKLGLISPQQVQQGLRKQLEDLFPEAQMKVDLKTRVPHYL